MADSLSLKPLTLGPMTTLGPAGGPSSNPFASFATGAGAGLRPASSANSAGASTSAGPPREERKKKNPADIVSYDHEFLMGFAKSCMTPAPAALESIPELRIDGDEEGEGGEGEGGAAGAARGAVARAAAEAGVSGTTEERDWRSRPTGGAEGAKGGKAEGAPAIVRAADVGRTAWAPSSDRASASSDSLSADATARSLKAVKGILNKLTPEKFDRLAAQLVDHASVSPDVLRGAIALVFEAAVAQPTFVATYADLCGYLSSRVPEFPASAVAAASGGDASAAKPLGFKRVLLNTCQEEFEGAAAARAELQKKGGAAGDDDGDDEAARASRQVKQRTLGTVRLISQLYLKGVVTEKIVHVCVQDLLGEYGSAFGGGRAPGSTPEEPSHDAIEAVCEVFQVSGKKLDAPVEPSEAAARSHAARLEAYFSALNRLSKSKTLPSRLRFMVRDVLDLRAARWVPRREGLAAKKLSEVRAEAAAELGLVPAALLLPSLASDLPALPSGTLAGGGAGGAGGAGASTAAAAGGDEELFPAFKGGDAGAGAAASSSSFSSEKVGDVGVVASAFLGEYKTPAVAPTSSTAAAPSTTGREGGGGDARPKKQLTEEEAESLASSLYTDYLATKDAAEAAAAARELLPGGADGEAGAALTAERLARIGIDRAVDAATDAEGDALCSALVSLGKAGGPVGPVALKAAIADVAGGLDDLALDVPKAASRLGNLVGSLLASSSLSPSDVPAFLGEVESAGPKRDLLLRAARVVRTEKGDDGLRKLKEGGLNAAEVAAPADFEKDEMPSAEAFLKESGLSALI